MQSAEWLRHQAQSWSRAATGARAGGDVEAAVKFERMAARNELAASIARLVAYTSIITREPPEMQEPAGGAIPNDADMIRASATALNNLMNILENHL